MGYRKRATPDSHQLELIQSRTLDQWYVTVNKIYLDRNYYRHPDSIFAHLVEIVGGLSLLASEKEKPGVDQNSYIAKAIGWWMALCGKLRIRSVEQMLWSKFPAVCPYCLSRPHDNEKCELAKAMSRGPNWGKVAQAGQDNRSQRPANFAAWYSMFVGIYTPQQQESFPGVFGRITEELGELAEAVRLFDLAPGYFFSEASDLFAWLIHFQSLRFRKTRVFGHDAERELSGILFDEYPDCCKECSSRLCVCPPVLRKTAGRIAHEMPLHFSSESAPGPLLTFTEAMEAFEISSQQITIGVEQLQVTTDLIEEVRVSVAELRRMSLETKLFGEAHTVTLINILEEVLKLAESERVTQQSVDAMLDAIQALPSEKRNVIVGFLTNIAANFAGPLAQALLAYVKSSASGV